MARKTKNKKKLKKSGKAGSRKTAPRKKLKKHAAPKRNLSRKKTTRKKKRIRGRGATVDFVSFDQKGLGARSAGQSGDLQGLSGIEGAASESVEELLEEGNAYEAEVVKGVEDAEAADEGEVVTHEVPEDDVPEEYLGEK